ncbi:MAG: DUF4395 domain-containing protein [Actinomycetota bacterium]|nr:DUF4395 domain-containing protein [Actinomycetota bacterium]
MPSDSVTTRTNPHTTQTRQPGAPEVDVRAPRFLAWITSFVLAAGLLLSSGWILLFQTAVFALGAFAGVRYSPYNIAFRSWVAPRLGPVVRREPQSPLRFAQLVGFSFAAVASIGYLVGAPVLGAIATGFALAAALLNATTGFCLGCEMYLLGQRAMHRSAPHHLTPHHQTRRTDSVRATEGV